MIMPSLNLAKGFTGAQADMTPATFISATATATIAAGAPVQLDGEGKCKPATTATSFLGIACGTADKREWAAGESVRIMQQGTIYLTTAATATAGAAIGYNASSAWADAVASTYKFSINGSQVVEGVTGAGLAKVRLFGTEITTL